MKYSREHKRLGKEWIGKHVSYRLRDYLRKVSLGEKFSEYYTGVVEGLSDNSALIEDRAENNTGNSVVQFTGDLIIKADGQPCRIDWAEIGQCRIID